MTTVVPPLVVDGVARQPLPFGLFSTVTFRLGDVRWEGGGVTFESLSCADVKGIGPWQCETTTGLPKDLTHATGAVGEFGEALPFTLYGHFHCGPVGWTPQKAQAKADEQLRAYEQRGAEAAFWTGSLDNSPTLEAATTTDVSVANATYVETLGLLENWLASEYGSLGVIHMTRQSALVGLATSALSVRDNKIVTSLGTPVAAGSGYPGTGPTGQVPAAHTSWMYATPAIFGYQSEIFHSSNRDGDLFDRSNNDLIAVAERSYLFGFDPCGVAAALTTLDAVIDGGTP